MTRPAGTGDSRQARRFDSNAFGKIDLAAGLWVEGAAYDARGDLVAYSDPTGTRTLYERDPAGRIVAIVDPTGARIEHRSPETCAEPGALSEYIRNWERQNNNGRPLDPNNPRDRRRIQRCVRDITSIQAQHPDGTARAVPELFAAPAEPARPLGRAAGARGTARRQQRDRDRLASQHAA